MPTTSDGKKFDYSKYGMSKYLMHAQRLAREKKNMGTKVGSLAIAGAGAALFAGHQYESNRQHKNFMNVVNQLGLKMHEGQYKTPGMIKIDTENAKRNQPRPKGSVPRVITGTEMLVDGKTKLLRPQHPRVQHYQAVLKKTRTINRINNFRAKKMSGGGGGGIYNVAQPLSDKNPLNKYSKKLK